MKLDTNAIVGELKKQAIRGINKTLKQAKQYAQEISPTDTKEYINSRKEQQAQVNGDQVEGILINDSEHAQIIEGGVLGRPYDYHKGPPRNKSTVIYSGVGNRTGQRTADQTVSSLKNNLANA